MDMIIPTRKIKIMFESNTLTSRILVRRLAVGVRLGVKGVGEWSVKTQAPNEGLAAIIMMMMMTMTMMMMMPEH